jgi:phospholipase/carboxylesterase
MVPLEPEKLPNLKGTDVLLSAGRYDPLANAQQTDHLRTLLEAAGASVTKHTEPTGHQMTQGDIETARRWLARP